MDNEKPSYYSMIPANVRYDENLTSNAKLLYGEITALANKNGSCWASNSYFANLYKVSNVTISKWINQLKKLGYIDVKIQYRSNTKQIEKRIISIATPLKKSLIPSQRKVKEGIKEKFKENNTSINNTSINNKDIVELPSTAPPEPQIPFKEIIDYLNSEANKHYRVTETNKRPIKARWNEGYKLHDFKKVIELKCLEWSEDEKMNQYLRPTTLFGNKFEGYLNQKPVRKSASGYDESKFEELPY